MKDNIKNNTATPDMLKTLNPNIKKDLIGDNTKSYSCSVVKEENNKDGELEVMLKLKSTDGRLDINSYRKLSRFNKTIDIAVCGCNSTGAVITPIHILTVHFNSDDFLMFNKIVSKSKFLKEAKSTSNGKLLYKFNIKIYDKHELNIDKTLSNYSDIFTQWYFFLCIDTKGALNIDAISDLATRLSDDEWCALDSIMY